ncbi:MAG: hypothetical protein U1E73_09365 [Planctomycetota bacterium]
MATPFAAPIRGSMAELFAAGALLLAMLVGVVESVMARLRLLQIPKLLVSASLLTAFAVVFLIDR